MCVCVCVMCVWCVVCVVCVVCVCGMCDSVCMSLCVYVCVCVCVCVCVTCTHIINVIKHMHRHLGFGTNKINILNCKINTSHMIQHVCKHQTPNFINLGTY